MQTLKNIYRRLDAMQRTLRFHIIASILVVAACAGVFGVVIATSYDLEAQRNAVEQALTGQSISERDEHAVSLVEDGHIIINGETYGSREILNRYPEVFGANGEITQPRMLAVLFVDEKIPALAPRWLLDQPQTTWMLAVVITLWLLLVVWIDLSLQLVLTLLGTAAAVGLALLLGSQTAMWLFAGFGLLVFTFILLTRALLVVLDPKHQVLAVAHTVLKEASRTRISLAFIIPLLLILPLLPLWLDTESPLRYQVQTFISRSYGVTYGIAAMLTLFLACSSVAFEIRDRQIWQLVSKPLSRFNYLLGKWIGVMALNLVILIVAGVSIFMYIQYLRSRPVDASIEGQLDVIQLRDTVLTARVARRPTYDVLANEPLRLRVEEAIARDPELGVDPEAVTVNKRMEIAREIQQAHLAAQRSIPPAGDSRTYRFTGLQEAGRRNAALTLRYKFYILENDRHETFNARFRFNDNPNTDVIRTFVPTQTHIILIGPDLVQPDGTLSVTIQNLYQPPPGSPYGAINFEAEDFEVLYEVANFEGNFLRAMFVTWAKLAFLAMLGIACATFLSFPVAVLTSLTVFFAATLTPFLEIALNEYYPPLFESLSWDRPGLIIQWAFMSSIRKIAEFLVWTFGGFGEYSPQQSLVEGRLISWFAVFRAFAVLGLVWSGFSLVLGYLVIRRRELAIYSGQG